MSVGAIHRIGCFAATTLDSLPYSGAILMLLPLCRMKLREVYPPLFITTVIATTCGTAAVIITCALFPGLTYQPQFEPRLSGRNCSPAYEKPPRMGRLFCFILSL